MKRALLLGAFMALSFGSLAHAVTLVPGYDLAYINSHNVSGCGIGCYQIGDKQFSGISIQGKGSDEGSWGDADVDISGKIDGDIVYIDFNMPATAGAFVGTASSVDFNLFYTVTAIGGQLITAIDQHVAGTAGLSNGFIQVAEHVNNSTNTAELANSNVTIPGDPNDPDGEANDVLTLSTPVSTANVRKDILLKAGTSTGPDGITSLTLLEQSFHQSPIPEPAEAAFLLGGLLSVGLYYKRKRAQA